MFLCDHHIQTPETSYVRFGQLVCCVRALMGGPCCGRVGDAGEGGRHQGIQDADLCAEGRAQLPGGPRAHAQDGRRYRCCPSRKPDSRGMLKDQTPVHAKLPWACAYKYSRFIGAVAVSTGHPVLSLCTVGALECPEPGQATHECSWTDAVPLVWCRHPCGGVWAGHIHDGDLRKGH